MECDGAVVGFFFSLDSRHQNFFTGSGPGFAPVDDCALVDGIGSGREPLSFRQKKGAKERLPGQAGLRLPTGTGLLTGTPQFASCSVRLNGHPCPLTGQKPCSRGSLQGAVNTSQSARLVLFHPLLSRRKAVVQSRSGGMDAA